MIYEKLAEIQKKLNAPKGQYNKFGGYAYRSCEDILEAVKPLLGDCVLTVSDDIVLIGERFYVKATARIALSADDYVENTAYAREVAEKKGMDASQITGATSSYARKYALNGLLAIDDSKDADTMKPEQPAELTPMQKLAKKYRTTEAELVSKMEKKAQKSIDTLKEMTDFLPVNRDNALFEFLGDASKAGIDKALLNELEAERRKHLEPLDDFIPDGDNIAAVADAGDL